jgi:hypothetical protein
VQLPPDGHFSSQLLKQNKNNRRAIAAKLMKYLFFIDITPCHQLQSHELIVCSSLPVVAQDDFPQLLLPNVPLTPPVEQFPAFGQFSSSHPTNIKPTVKNAPMSNTNNILLFFILNSPLQSFPLSNYRKPIICF